MRNKLMIIGGAVLMGLSSAQAAVPVDEAEKLKSTLTPFGAERAGNAEGTIPEWTGGLSAAPAGYKAGDWMPDPFADEKPLFTITAENYAQYADKLSPSQIDAFKRYPDQIKMNVYPTHRTAAAPKWVVENTYNNALNAQLNESGTGVNGACAGIPFPIPKNGSEVIQNHLLRWKGKALHMQYTSLQSYMHDPSPIISNEANTLWQWHYYDQDAACSDGQLFSFFVTYNYPARRKGEIILINDAMDAAATPRQAWQYIPGQRRVRRAPTVAYDTPDSSIFTYDDAYLYNGAPDRYDWKLVGKKEMYIPYNGYDLVSAYGTGKLTKEDAIASDPKDLWRWELHRVWVVEATLKEGTRHIYAKRTFYIDEDTWNISLTEKYDGKGELWRYTWANVYQAFDPSLQGSFARPNMAFDVESGQFVWNYIDTHPLAGIEPQDKSFYTPQSLRKQAKR
ncbi:DUF1329 domain-containing protein [Marinobacterium maritimum]|uniref:DUF1329 domain-containing protein n=1 Tax=Marinobacterium maritimum TaxID=500162 RepID=A0ABN1I5V9_9GAMM